MVKRSEILVADTRDNTLDWIKGLLIACVVVGHVGRCGFAEDALDKIVLRGIYSFHMPLFMFLCGYFFKVTSAQDIFVKTWKRLLLPYCVASVIFAALSMMQDKTLFAAVRGFALGRDNAALWFLYALAFVRLVVALGLAVKQKLPGLFIPSCVALYAIGVASPIRCEPWILFYFWIGFAFSFARASLPSGWLGLAGFAAFMFIGHPWYSELGWQTILLSLCAFMALKAIANYAVNIRGVNIFSSLGKHTMVILIFHPIFLGLVKYMQSFILHVDASGIGYFVLSTAFAIVGCLLLERLLIKLNLNFLFGIKKEVV